MSTFSPSLAVRTDGRGKGLDMARRMVTYDDIAPPEQRNMPLASSSSGSVNGGTPTSLNGTGKQPHWTPDGRPISASAARKHRKVLQLLGAGQLATAEGMLAGMGPAKNSVEMQEAWAWATRKAKGAETGADTGEEGGSKENGGAKVVGDDDGYALEADEDPEGEEAEVAWKPGAAIDWQGAIQQTARADAKQLSHAEIWDDSALIDAWDAAMEEYKLFDAQRSALQKKVHAQHTEQASSNGQSNGSTKRDRAEVSEEREAASRPAKRSALWHDAPAVGSQAALEAKVTATKEAAAHSELLEERKRQARALLAQMSGPGEEEDAQRVPVSETTSKCVVPPSSSVSDNPAWQSACAVVADTPNMIGLHTPGRHDGTHDHATTESGPTDAQAAHEEVLQNLAMAWYYAGYYQAMAMQMWK